MNPAGRFAFWRQALPEERLAACLAFAFHFLVLASYYLIRPLRDALGLEGGVGNLQWLFTATFVVMLFIVPVFGALVARVAPSRFVPGAYRAVALVMTGFGVLIYARYAPVQVGQAFFVWVSVYNLFIVSVFWSVMVDRFNDEQAQRLFGLIAAGGTLGTFVGPALAAVLSHAFGPVALTFLAVVMLELAVWAYKGLMARTPPRAGAPDNTRAIGGGLWGGAVAVFRSPYLLGLVAFMLFHTSAATFLYFEQGRIVAVHFADVASRTRYFASVDLTVSCVTLFMQLVLAAPFLRYAGIGGALAMLPLATLLAFIAMAFYPVPLAVAVAQGFKRAVEFALVRPAREVLWTVVSREQKYKAKNFIETVVYRGGDAASGWASAGITALGASFLGLTLVMVPLTGLWAWLGLTLARMKHKAARDRPEEHR